MAGQELDRVHHVAIAVRDVAEGVVFYTERFKCRVAYQDPTWALIDFENMQLALVLPEEHPPHLGLTSREAERFGELKAHRDGTRSVYINDPAGNSVEILKMKEDGGIKF